jgi:hypothetical protein
MLFSLRGPFVLNKVEFENDASFRVILCYLIYVVWITIVEDVNMIKYNNIYSNSCRRQYDKIQQHI